MKDKPLYKTIFIIIVLFFSFNTILKVSSQGPIDSISITNNASYVKAKDYLSQSKTDMALVILYKLLDSVPLNSNYWVEINISVTEGYRQKRDYNKAIDLLKSLLLLKNISAENKAHIYNRMASIYGSQISNKNNIDSTIKYSNLCIQIASKNKLEYLVASSQNEIAYTYMYNNNFNKAEKYYIKSFNYFFSSENYIYSANVSINLSNNYLKQGEFTASIKIIDTVINIMDEQQNRNMFMRLYLQKAAIYEKWNKMDSAYKYLSRGRIAQKHFFLDRMDEQVFEMNAKYDLQLKENVIIQEKLIQEKTKKNLFILIIVIVLLIIAVIIIFIAFYVKRKTVIYNQSITEYEKQILQSKISLKNKELTNAIVHANRYNNTLCQIKETLLTKSKDEAVKNINIAINNEYNWINFLKTFNELKPDFFHKLEAHHNNITVSEKKLAALLSMKLSSKEISDVLNITLQSVNKNRQRLRKKYSIDTQIDLIDYFNQF